MTSYSGPYITSALLAFADGPKAQPAKASLRGHLYAGSQGRVPRKHPRLFDFVGNLRLVCFRVLTGCVRVGSKNGRNVVGEAFGGC